MPAEGLDDLLEAFGRVELDVADRREVHLDAAEPVLDQARRDVPTVSFALKRTIKMTATAKFATIKAGKSSVPWAGPVHFGHFNRPQGGFIRPDPFLYDAADERADEVVARYDVQVERSLRRRGLT